MDKDEKIEIKIIDEPIVSIDTLLIKQGFYRHFEINTVMATLK